jgi:hypothetical protein
MIAPCRYICDYIVHQGEKVLPEIPQNRLGRLVRPAGSVSTWCPGARLVGAVITMGLRLRLNIVHVERISSVTNSNLSSFAKLSSDCLVYCPDLW